MKKNAFLLIFLASVLMFVGCDKKSNKTSTKEIETILENSKQLLEQCESLTFDGGTLSEDSLNGIETALKLSKDLLAGYSENVSESKLEAEKNIQEIEKTVQEKRAEIKKMNSFLGKDFYVAQNLRLRENQSAESKIKCTMTFGTKVNVLDVGEEQAIDSVKGNWVKVEVASSTYDRDGNPLESGTTGWCFSGYLSEKISYANLIGVWEEVRFDKNGKLVYKGNMKNVKNVSDIPEGSSSGLVFDSNGNFVRIGEYEYDDWLGMYLAWSWVADSYKVHENLVDFSQVCSYYTSAELIGDMTVQIVYLEKDALGIRWWFGEGDGFVEYRRAGTN